MNLENPTMENSKTEGLPVAWGERRIYNSIELLGLFIFCKKKLYNWL